MHWLHSHPVTLLGVIAAFAGVLWQISAGRDLPSLAVDLALLVGVAVANYRLGDQNKRIERMESLLMGDRRRAYTRGKDGSK